MTIALRTPLSRCFNIGLILSLTVGCSALRPPSAEQPSFYSFESAHIERPERASNAAFTLIVSPPHADPGYDSQRIIYVRESYRLEYYAHSEWVDTPAHMLAPLVLQAVQSSGAFRAAVLTPSLAAGDLRLDTVIVRLQHDSGSRPSNVRFTLRATIIDNTTRAILAWREFDETVEAASETPYGGVIAANRAVQAVMTRLASFCAETTHDLKPLSVTR